MPPGQDDLDLDPTLNVTPPSALWSTSKREKSKPHRRRAITWTSTVELRAREWTNRSMVGCEGERVVHSRALTFMFSRSSRQRGIRPAWGLEAEAVPVDELGLLAVGVDRDRVAPAVLR